MQYAVIWDNGKNAVGQFPWTFETFSEATDFGEEWLMEATQQHAEIGEEGDEPSYEVIKVDAHGAHGPLDHKIEGTFAHFDRYVADDR